MFVKHSSMFSSQCSPLYPGLHTQENPPSSLVQLLLPQGLSSHSLISTHNIYQLLMFELNWLINMVIIYGLKWNLLDFTQIQYFKMESRYKHTVTKAGYLYPAPLESSSFPRLPWKNVCRNVVGTAVWFITYLVSVVIRRPNIELRHDQRTLIEFKKKTIKFNFCLWYFHKNLRRRRYMAERFSIRL